MADSSNVRAELPADALGAAPPIFPVRSPDDVVPLTWEQRSIWLDLTRANDSLAYNEPMIIRFTERSSPEIVGRALEALIDRHEALRASIDDRDGEPVQVIHAKVRALLPAVDLSHLPPAEQEPAVHALLAEDAAIPFDLARPPLLRGRVVRLGDSDHRLIFVLHHILFDGRSLGEVLTRELPLIHAAIAEGNAPVLPPPVARYGDYAVWQRSTTRDKNWDRDVEFWRDTLAGGTRAIALPTDRAYDGIAPRDAATEAIDLDPSVMRGVAALARAHRTSAYTVLLASVTAQLRRYGGSDDITIGSVIDTRMSARLGGMLGYCLNTVALRSRPRLEQPFAELLDEVRDLLFGAYEHGSVPFERVAQMLDGAIPGTENGRFHVMFSMQPALSAQDAGVMVTPLTPPRSKADLYIELEQIGARLQGRFTYDRALFDAATAQCIARHWATLLTAAIADPATPVGDLPILPPAEAALLGELGRGDRRPIPDATLHELIGRTIEDYPDALAVTCGTTRWTYAELGARADAVAEALLAAGVSEGTLVALCVERSASMVAAILGILKTGAAYVPLDPSFPAARLATILADANPAMLIHDAPSRRLFAAWEGAMLAIEQIAAAPSGAALPPAGAPDSLAYVIYTSGSTGIPKGVEIAHRGVVNVMESMRREHGFAPGDTMLGLSRVTFDMSVPDLFLPLIVGGTLAVAPSGAVIDPRQIAAEIERSGCSLMQATPATWQMPVNDGWPGKAGLKAVCGGEALRRTLADQLLDRGLRLWNGYGPTEATIYTTMEEVRRGEPITIGRPIDNVEVLILDQRGHHVPCNVVGHLHIAGPGLARRYRDATLNEQAFVERDGKRLYRSGDLALRRRDGRIEWRGRVDGQVKIRGFRINVGDVEAAIATCPGVGLVVVSAIDSNAGTERDLAAHVTPSDGAAAPDYPALRAWLAKKLPAYMIPTRYMVLEQMPISASGKVERDALPPFESEVVMWHEPEPAELPRGDIENRIAAIWREVLGINAVGATDDFFDLGGHSLLAAKLIGRLSTEFGQRLPFATLTRAPTIRQLAAILSSDDELIAPPRTLMIGSVGRPLFWIDATPNFRIAYFRDLGAALDGEIALIGLPVDTERFARTASDDCMAAITTQMADTIVDTGHRGPHLLGGWCNGGILALVVANHLRARGHDVEAVIMLDATNQAEYRRKVQRLRLEVAQFINSPADERPSYVREMLAGYVSRFRRRVLPARDEANVLRNVTDRYARIVRAMEPPSYDGRVIDIRPAGGVGAESAKWGDLLSGPIDLVRVPGGHRTVLHPPYVKGLARSIVERVAVSSAVIESRAAEDVG